MKISSLILRSILASSVLAFLASVPAARSQGTTFTYQGRLADAGSPVSGSYDLRFTLWDSGGLQIGGPYVVAPVPVSSGLFTVPVNFGAGVFTGPARFLQIEAKVFGAPGGYGPPITPRQALTAAPYAITASNLTGMLPASQLSGTVAPGNLSPNVALLNRDPQTFTGQNNFGSFVGIGTTTPGSSLQVNGGIRARGGPPGGFGGLNNGYAFTGNGGDDDSGMFSDADGTLEFYVNANEAVRITPSGSVGIGTASPTEKFHVAGSYLRVDGIGGEAAYLGGDGFGGDVQVGSLNPAVGNLALYNAAAGVYMNLFANDMTYFGLQTKLDVADNFTATVRAADFTLGHSSRRGSPGRALVDLGGALYVNFASDWPDTVVNSRLTVAGFDMFIGPSATGHFGEANGFDFNTTVSSEGLLIEQAFPHAGTGGTESSGIHFDGDSISMWSPGDNNRLLKIYDEDGMAEKFYIDSAGRAVANGVILTSSRRFKEHVTPIAGALDKVSRLQGVTFDWVKDKGGKAGIGFIAEDVAEVLPELVEWEESGKDAVGLQYANVTTVTVEAIKELKTEKDQEIEALRRKNAEVQGQLTALEAKEQAREARLSALETLLQQLVKSRPETGLENGGGQ